VDRKQKQTTGNERGIEMRTGLYMRLALTVLLLLIGLATIFDPVRETKAILMVFFFLTWIGAMTINKDEKW